MDRFPTPLIVAGTAPKAAYPSDGIDLLPVLVQHVTPSPRKLFWPDKYNDQQSACDNDWKYLKILDNTFLFECCWRSDGAGKLKERHSDVYERLVSEWNATMLPLDPDSFTGGFTGRATRRPFWREGALNGRQSGSKSAPKKKEPVKHRLFNLCLFYPLKDRETSRTRLPFLADLLLNRKA
jgi:hypothetical protein